MIRRPAGAGGDTYSGGPGLRNLWVPLPIGSSATPEAAPAASPNTPEAALAASPRRPSSATGGRCHQPPPALAGHWCKILRSVPPAFYQHPCKASTPLL
jgi:hypothetical protein